MTTKELRRNQGVLAVSIKTNHNLFRDAQRSVKYDPKADWRTNLDAQNVVCKARRVWQEDKDEFRHRHIGYSLARGRTMEQIEVPAENNKPDGKRVAMYREEYEKAFAEGRAAHEARTAAVRAGA